MKATTLLLTGSVLAIIGGILYDATILQSTGEALWIISAVFILGSAAVALENSNENKR